MRSGGGDARPISSRLLLELRRERQEAEERLTPARRLEAAYTLSRNLQRLFRAGLRAQGFSDTEIEALWVRRR